MSSVPEEVIIEILSRLPVKSLFRFKCVCKAWLHLLTTTTTDSDFAQLQLTRSTKSDNTTLVFTTYDSRGGPPRFFSTECNIKAVEQGIQVNLSAPFVTPALAALAEAFNIIGSCNGLLCLIPLHNTSSNFYLWNPCTKEYLIIPSPPHQRRLEHQHAAHRFGFHPLRNEYKLVIIFSSSFLELVPAPAHVYVYTLGAVSSWRRAVQDIPYHVMDGFSYRSLVNGAFHWNAIPSGAYRLNLILSFDLGSEVFGEIPTPTGVDVNPKQALISELHGNLCLSNLSTPRQGSPPQVQIWVMKHYGVVTSWSKMYVFEQFSNWAYCDFLPVDVLEDGEILFFQEVHRELLVYDPRSNSTKLFPHLTNRFFQVYPLVRSLVSPRFINGVNNQELNR